MLHPFCNILHGVHPFTGFRRPDQPVVGPVVKGFVVVELVEPLPGLHEGEPAAEGDLLLGVVAV